MIIGCHAIIPRDSSPFPGGLVGATVRRSRTFDGHLLSIIGAAAVLCVLWLAGCWAKPRVRLYVLDAENDSAILAATVTVGDRPLRIRSDGSFRVPADGGSYRVDVSAPGYVARAITETMTESESDQAHGVALEHRWLRGRLNDVVSAQPVEGAHVQLGQVLTVSDKEGCFELDAVAQTTMTIAGAGYLPGEVGQSEVEALFAPSGEMVNELSISMTPRVLTGTVVEAGTSTPISGALVSVGDSQGGSDADGHYLVSHVEPGTTITFTSKAHRPVAGLSYDGQTEQNAVLEPWEVSLIVRDPATNKALPGVHISAGSTVTQTDDQGRTSLRVLPGTRMSVKLDDYRPMTFAYEGEDLLEVFLQPSWMKGELRDRVADEPVSGATVQAFSAEDVPILLQPDKEGRFELQDALDLITLTLKAPGYRLHSMPVTRTGNLRIELEPFEARAIYVPFGLLTRSDRIEDLLALVENSDLTALVVDVKSDNARIAWPSAVPLAQEIGAHQKDVTNLPDLLEECRARGIYVIARIVVFKDDLLARNHPEWAIKRANGQLYRDGEGLRWADPYRQEVRDYNTGLAKEVAAMGFSEIQFDYIRFPSDGRTRDLVYEKESNSDTRSAAIAEFCAQAHQALSRTQAFLSADIYGLTPWVNLPADMGIGQRIEDMAPHMDYLSPMLYPATFIQGNLGYRNPALYPYEVVYRSVIRMRERTDTKIRPWLQHYSWRVAYGALEYVKQRRGAEDAQSSGWLFWNAAGRYQPEVFEAGVYERFPEAIPPQAEDSDAQKDEPSDDSSGSSGN